MSTIDYSTLKQHLGASLILPGEIGYETHRRAWNRLFDHHPAAIARCRGVSDVIAAVNFARDTSALVSIRGGGHSYAGKSSNDGGLVIDLSLMDDLRIDPSTKTLRAGPGTKWDAVIREAGVFGLAVPSAPPQTGVSGVTLGGGVGLLSRKWGMTSDNLISADVVTSDGRFVRASADENADLFWALRGGLGNFGVVTSLEIQMHDLPPKVLGGQILHPWSSAGEALRFLRDFMAEAPAEVGAFALAFVLPPLEFFPAEHHGKSCLAFSVIYAGPPQEGHEVLAPLRAFGEPFADTITEQTYEAIMHADDAAIEAWDRVYCRSHNLPELTDDAIDTIVDLATEIQGDVTLLGLLPMTGAITEPGETDTAYPHRDGAWEFDVWTSWSGADRDDDLKSWTRSVHESIAPFASGSVYVNLLADDEADRVPHAFGENWERLRAMKKKWDPDNVFDGNHNVTPD